jgi:hypothetical protein
MLKIQCPTCKSPISGRKSHTSCPWCGSALPILSVVNPHDSAGRSKTWLARKEWTVALVAAIFAGFLITVGFTRMTPDQETDDAWRSDEALATCRSQIQSLSPAGEVPPLPEAQNQGAHPEFYFVWPKDTRYYSPSDKDLNVPAATCRGDLRSGRIVELFMNGQDVTTVLQLDNSSHRH